MSISRRSVQKNKSIHFLGDEQIEDIYNNNNDNNNNEITSQKNYKFKYSKNHSKLLKGIY